MPPKDQNQTTKENENFHLLLSIIEPLLSHHGHSFSVRNSYKNILQYICQEPSKLNIYISISKVTFKMISFPNRNRQQTTLANRYGKTNNANHQLLLQRLSHSAKELLSNS